MKISRDQHERRSQALHELTELSNSGQGRLVQVDIRGVNEAKARPDAGLHQRKVDRRDRGVHVYELPGRRSALEAVGRNDEDDTFARAGKPVPSLGTRRGDGDLIGDADSAQGGFTLVENTVQVVVDKDHP